jgi:hypothetical protein
MVVAMVIGLSPCILVIHRATGIQLGVMHAHGLR